MKYEVITVLRNAGPISQEANTAIEGTLLVGEIHIAKWTSGECREGEQHNFLSPAFHNGKKAWLLTEEWDPACGYCAEGIQDLILDFESGFKLLLENECYRNLWIIKNEAQ